ncbi:hypothetical protein HMPREF9057_01775 [Actinomyces sp. oral taxon 171 str. F0337]|nr:hypothetical protein HMPREF9057_01775 [Actinomyces sp. oral taxon 171 str. F0337]
MDARGGGDAPVGHHRGLLVARTTAVPTGLQVGGGIRGVAALVKSGTCRCPGLGLASR